MTNCREKYSCYEYEIFEIPDDDYPEVKYYTFNIYGEGCYPYDDGVIEFTNGCESEQEARAHAIKNIDLLESGEPTND